MLFNSIEFMLFFPTVILVYFIIPRKVRCIWLLLASYIFYMNWNLKYSLLMLFATLVTYFCGIILDRCNSTRKTNLKKWCIIGGICCLLGMLGLFKYADFLLHNIDRFLTFVGRNGVDYRFNLLLPVGISFYTFQSMGYIIDVYRGKIKAERNILKYALFVSFFPQLVAGPIERSDNLLTQIRNIEKANLWDATRIQKGLLVMLWGFFEKLVVADRVALVVSKVITNYSEYGFMEIWTAVILFAIQIYCDFGGYTLIARGAAQIMGISLTNNFRQPYFALSVKEFWHRWHISLSRWFTDYLYIPLGGNRKGVLRKYLNVLIVFICSGFWHGASWNFVIWGLLHACYQIIGDIKLKLLERTDMLSLSSRESWSKKIRKMVVTFTLINFAWIFFVCNNVEHALGVIRQMFSTPLVSGFLAMGVSVAEWFILVFAIIVLVIVDILHEKKKAIFEGVFKQEIWLRWGLYVGLLWSIVIFGVWGSGYDVGEFIYFQF